VLLMRGFSHPYRPATRTYPAARGVAL